MVFPITTSLKKAFVYMLHNTVDRNPIAQNIYVNVRRCTYGYE